MDFAHQIQVKDGAKQNPNNKLRYQNINVSASSNEMQNIYYINGWFLATFRIIIFPT